MNALRTIQRDEKQWWIDELFDPTRRSGGPAVPFSFPFPHKLHQTAPGELLYVVWRGAVIGYAAIDAIVPHAGDFVGTKGQQVKPGDSIVIKGLFTKWNSGLTCAGFPGVRYVPDLHLMPRPKAQRAIDLAVGR